MKLLRYQARNVLRVSEIDLNLQGRHLVLIGGRNDQGKTSALNAVLIALCGRSGCDWPEVCLKDGENEGWVKVDLVPDGKDAEEWHEAVGLTVELHLKRKRNGQVLEEFRILDSTGEEAPEPRTLLKRLYHLRAFDPLHFARLGKKERRDTLVQLVGLDFSAQKKELTSLYEQRTAVNRDGKNLRARVDALPLHHDDAPPSEVVVSELLADLEARRKCNTMHARERAKLPYLDKEITGAEEDLRKTRADIVRLTVVMELQAKVLVDLRAKRDVQAQVVAGLTDLDENAVIGDIKDAEVTNRKVRENRQRVAMDHELGQLRSLSEFLTAAMEKIEATIATAIQKAPWPLPGLSLDADGVLLNGLPFEQASKSARIMASVKIGMALNPSLRLLVCEDGSDLDQESLDSLGKILEDHDFQMLLELVTRGPEDEGRCAVVIEDGRVAKTN